MVGFVVRCYNLAYRWWHGLTDPDAEVGSLLRIEVARYRGPLILLADGTEVRRGDRIGVLHLHNERVARLHTDDRATPTAGFKLRRAFLASLRELARRVVAGERYAGVRAFMAETIFHTDARRVGFESRPLPSARSRLVAAYERTMVAHYHPLGRRRAARLRSRDARAIWISRSELLCRYGDPMLDSSRC